MFFHHTPFVKRTWGVALILGFTLFPLFLSGALANEVWIPPANKAAENAAGNWPMANLGGSTYFGFHVPDNMDTNAALPQAFILIIPTKDGDIDYDLTLSIGENGDPHNSASLTIPQTGLLHAGGIKDQLTEIDVSSIFTGVSLNPGASYVSLNFDTAGLGRRVVGLRFQYVGPEGPQGEQGPQGIAGVNGVDGAQGPQGEPGPQGVAGLNGIDGTNGADGATGPAGPQGDPGPQGLAGVNGIDGTNGADGATGPAGPQGDPGPQGLAGVNGIDGTNGADGATGPAGPQGVAGVDGNDGAQGPAGPQGPQGVPGADGADGLLSGPNPASNIYVRGDNITVSQLSFNEISAQCDDVNDLVITGGCIMEFDTNPWRILTQSVGRVSSGGRDSWQCQGRNNDAVQTALLIANIYCLSVP